MIHNIFELVIDYFKIMKEYVMRISDISINESCCWVTKCEPIFSGNVYLIFYLKSVILMKINWLLSDFDKNPSAIMTLTKNLNIVIFTKIVRMNEYLRSVTLQIKLILIWLKEINKYPWHYCNIPVMLSKLRNIRYIHTSNKILHRANIEAYDTILFDEDIGV
jgi:hypothetical protein